MSFTLSDIRFDPGLYANRSKRASTGRWVDGNLVRFPDGVPQQMGGWVAVPFVGGPVLGRARDFIAWRPNSQAGRLALIGTHSNAYRFDGGAITDVTPVGFVPGRADSLIGAGYGAALYGDDDYGTPRTTSSNTLEAASWTFDMFGEVVLGCYSGDAKLYEYLDAPGAKLVPIAGAPSARAMCVSDERHVFAFGCDGDPSNVRWSDRENRTVWTPSGTNRAGGYQVQITSAFQCGKRCRGQVLAWTQTELFGFAPLANSLVYSRDPLGAQCGAMGPNAVAVVTDRGGEVAYWMSPHGFYTFDGTVRELPCDLQDYVFKDINIIQRVKTQVRSNKLHGEIWFFYCSAASNEIDRAVVYCYRNNTWSKANISRLVWLDTGIFPLPLALDQNGVIYEHERGDTANGAALSSYVLSHPLTIGTGQSFTDVSDFWPDMDPLSGTAAVSFICRDFPGAPDVVHGPFPFTPADEKIDLAISTRQIQIKIAGVSGYWELGIPLLNRQMGSGR